MDFGFFFLTSHFLCLFLILLFFIYMTMMIASFFYLYIYLAMCIPRKISDAKKEEREYHSDRIQHPLWRIVLNARQKKRRLMAIQGGSFVFTQRKRRPSRLFNDTFAVVRRSRPRGRQIGTHSSWRAGKWRATNEILRQKKKKKQDEPYDESPKLVRRTIPLHSKVKLNWPDQSSDRVSERGMIRLVDFDVAKSPRVEFIPVREREKAKQTRCDGIKLRWRSIELRWQQSLASQLQISTRYSDPGKIYRSCDQFLEFIATSALHFPFHLMRRLYMVSNSSTQVTISPPAKLTWPSFLYDLMLLCDSQTPGGCRMKCRLSSPCVS